MHCQCVSPQLMHLAECPGVARGMMLSLDWLIKRLWGRKKVLPSYTIVPCLAGSKLIVPANSKRRVLHHQNDVSIKGRKRRDYEAIVIHVTVMCFDKKTCAYQAAATHGPFLRSTT